MRVFWYSQEYTTVTMYLTVWREWIALYRVRSANEHVWTERLMVCHGMWASVACRAESVARCTRMDLYRAVAWGIDGTEKGGSAQGYKWYVQYILICTLCFFFQM